MTRLWVVHVLALATGCDPIAVGPAPPEAAREDPAAEEAELDERPCAQLTRAECMRAVHCTLAAAQRAPGHVYACREAQGNCEVGLRQIDADRDRCADRTGCAWRDSACYCACRGVGRTAVPDGEEAPPCDCECGGGPPPGCGAR